MQKTLSNRGRVAHALPPALLSAVLTVMAGWPMTAQAAAPSVAISQVPMTVTIPAHPQILLAVANSQSMDGDLSGAILTGSGLLGSSMAGLQASSSPVNFTIPAGFTPPLNAGSGGVAPYTVSANGNQLSNSPSRLNVAKAGISAILNSYMSSADFGLMDYSTSGLTLYTTWVYQMSAVGGFTFSATVPISGRYVANPCYNINPGQSNPVSQDCNKLNPFYAGQGILSKPYMIIGASSDDPSINDVLYAGGNIDPLCVVSGGPSPPTPFPPNFSLSNYNTGGVLETYSNQVNSCAPQTGPTNAGFVPYSTQVMYEQRGFGFYTNGETATDAETLVTMTSAGATPTAASVAAAIAKFAPNLAPETNSTNTAELKAEATQAPMAGLIQGANNYFTNKNPPSTNGCNAQRYVVLLTDGLPTMDLRGRAWPPLGSAAAAGYGVTASFNADGSLGSTNSQALTDAITNLQNLAATGVKTYVIGLGAGVDPALNLIAAQTLTAMAVAGGTSTYFPATSPQAVTNALQTIIGTILAATQSTASAAVNSTGLNTSSVVYQSQFVTSDTLQDWTGDLNAFPIDPVTGIVNTLAAPKWSAQTQLDTQSAGSGWNSGRIIATYDPVTKAGTAFRWSSSGSATTGIASSTALGQKLTTFTADPSGSDVLNYLRGSSTQEQRNGGQFRNRSHTLGDIVDSSPVYIGAPSGSNQSASYLSFAAAKATRPAVLYVGAGDGMLHAIDAATGSERFAYIPAGVYANLINLASPYYNGRHQFFVDGSPQASDVQFTDLTWHTVLVGTEAAGGSSVYALDVSDPSILTSEAAVSAAVLWDFTDTDMGLGFSTPAIANTTNGWQIFVGNGYNSTQQKPFLYALNPQSGAVIKKLDLCAAVPLACNLNASNGLSTAIAVNSGGQIAGAANIVYAGDLQGNLWRVDISNVNPASWTVTVLFQARDAGGTAQPITTAPVATLNPRYPQVLGTMVYVATGELLGIPDLTNAQVQTIYGVYDPPVPYALAPVRGGGSLVQQTISIAASNSTAILDTANAVNIPANKGWYMDLSLATGLRVVTDPRLESGGALVLSSYQPSRNACASGGESYLLVINFATGGAFTSPQFDLNGDHVINTADTVQVPLTGGGTTTANPVGMDLGAVFAAAPTIRSGNFSTGSAVKLITESTGQIKSVIEKGASKTRTAWWEIRQ